MAEEFSPDYSPDCPEPDTPHLGDGQWCFDLESIPVYLLMLNNGHGLLCSCPATEFIQGAQNIADARQIPGPFRGCFEDRQRMKWIQDHLQLYDDPLSGKQAVRFMSAEHKNAAL
eukprot:11265119-Heterocapsa_arctica.AAC.1